MPVQEGVGMTMDGGDIRENKASLGDGVNPGESMPTSEKI